MGQAPIYDGINQARLYSSKARGCPQPGPAVMRTGNHLAIVCLFCGAAFAAFVSGSLEQRIGNLFCFGVIPAVVFYAGGHILGQLLVFGVPLCDMIMARLFSVCRALGKRSLKLGRHACLELVDRGARTKRSQWD